MKKDGYVSKHGKDYKNWRKDSLLEEATRSLNRLIPKDFEK